MIDLKQRRRLCDDLEYAVLADRDLLTTVIDEFVYHLDDKEIEYYEGEVTKIFGEDD